ncbi:hypothetical protein E3N88_06277 [Mikania micrantha]|uniref:Transferase, Chloramphenicol acetyltransferase-like domain protein n=1 Tax=Mikania micrantha TaxID=192012 RepID=A0A5N6PP19_9ASTR|nr:hypothetical protein E3N88_06277 [Mikania micrantha]
MDIKIRTTRFIKPSNPTPENLHHFKLSALDQLAPATYTSMIFYYKISDDVDVSDRCGQLVKSLSEVLNSYYPLAGRITQNRLEVDCRDQGVKYLETQVSARLDDFLSHGSKTDHVGQLIGSPDDQVTNPLVTVQVNVFECGSLVIGVTASHKVTDAYNLARFVNEWASMNRTGCSNGSYAPSFDNLGFIFPPLDIPLLEPEPIKFDPKPVILTKRYVFNKTAISNLRAKAGPNNTTCSRVTLVTSLIWNTLITIDHVKSGRFRDCLLVPAMSLRGKIGSPAFPLYDADFGWGKPCWVTAAARGFDMITLMDDKHGDGVEAWVSLNEKDMHLFEQDQDIIAFTT